MSESILEFVYKEKFNKSVEGVIQAYTKLEEQVRLLRIKCNDLQVKLNDQYANDKEIVRLKGIIDEQDTELRNSFGIVKEKKKAITERLRKDNEDFKK